MTGKTKVWDLEELGKMRLDEIVNDWNYLEGLTERQHATIEQLKARVAELEAEIAKVEHMLEVR